jgi:uncharacterized protein YigE (DUF2233 family)
MVISIALVSAHCKPPSEGRAHPGEQSVDAGAVTPTGDDEEQNIGWQERQPGLSYRFKARTGAGTEIKLHAFRASLDRFRLSAVDARQGQRQKALVDSLASEVGALVAVNGTFFDPDGKPLGLLITNGVELNPLRRADWGVLEVRGGRARLFHTRDYRIGDKQTEFAIQCGPRVVIGGSVPKLKPQGAARRTALCIADPSAILVMASEGAVTSTELGTLLAAPEAQGGFECRDALLLDGGPSTQLTVHIGDFTHTLVGWPVPNAVVLLPRSGESSPRNE